MLAQAELDQRGPREFGWGPEPTPLGIEAPREPAHETRKGFAERGLRGRHAGRAGRPARQLVGEADLAGDRVDERVRLLLDLVAALRPGLGEGGEHPPEPGHAVPVGRRVVGPSVEGPAVGRAEHRQGPAPRAGQRLYGGHVHRVDVGALLPVDLHRHERTGEVLGGRGILEALVGHHVTPVAGRVADGDEQGPVLPLGRCERLLAPGVPVDGVLRVLAEIRARLHAQTVHRTDATACRSPLRPPGR